MTSVRLSLLACVALVATTAAQQQVRRDVTLRGEVCGAGDERARVTVYHSDGHRNVVEAVAEGLSEPGGAFALREVAWYRGRGWDWHWCIVVARVGERVGMLQVRSDVDTAALTIELGPVRELRGVLRDADSGEPIAGAWVWPMIFGKLGTGQRHVWPTAPLMPWHARTDADGRWLLSGVPAFSHYVLDVGGPRHGRRLLQVDDPKRPVEAALAAAGRITGRVLQIDGRPAEGIDIWASGSRDGYARARTDADGRYVLESLGAEKFLIEARWPGRPTIAAPGVFVAVGETVADLDLQCVAWGFIVGRLVDSDGKPVAAGERVYVHAKGPEVGGRRAGNYRPVAADGTFRVPAPVGSNRIVVNGATIVSVASTTVIVVAGADAEVDVKVRSAPPRRR